MRVPIRFMGVVLLLLGITYSGQAQPPRVPLMSFGYQLGYGNLGNHEIYGGAHFALLPDISKDGFLYSGGVNSLGNFDGSNLRVAYNFFFEMARWKANPSQFMPQWGAGFTTFGIYSSVDLSGGVNFARWLYLDYSLCIPVNQTTSFNRGVIHRFSVSFKFNNVYREMRIHRRALRSRQYGPNPHVQSDPVIRSPY